MRGWRCNKSPFHSFISAKLMKLPFVISSFHHLSQFSLCSYELHSIVTCYNFGACLKGKESPENLDEFHCRDINGKIQMHSLCILACEYYSIVHSSYWFCCDLLWLRMVQNNRMLYNRMGVSRASSDALANQPWTVAQPYVPSFSIAHMYVYTVLASLCPPVIWYFLRILAAVVATPSWQISWKYLVIRIAIGCCHGRSMGWRQS